MHQFLTSLLAGLAGVVLGAHLLHAAAPVRVAPQYEDSLRVVVAAHESISLCINAGGDGLPLMELVIGALDTARFDKVSVQYPAEGYDEWDPRAIIKAWGKDSLPHVLVFCVGDQFVSHYGHTVASYFEWAGQNHVGLVLIGSHNLKTTWGGKTYLPFYSREVFDSVRIDEPPFFDGRWLSQPGDSVFIRIEPQRLVPSSREYYPNTNGILRNLFDYVLPAVQPDAPATLLFEPFGGTGRCKTHTLRYPAAPGPHYQTVAFQQGFNAAADTLYTRTLNEQGQWARDSSGTRLYTPHHLPPGPVGNPTQYSAITTFQDTIDYTFFDNQGVARDTVKAPAPIIRRAVMLNFNPGYLTPQLAAEQLIYDAVMHASLTHMIGRPQVRSTPPPVGPISALGRPLHARRPSTPPPGPPAALYTINGRRVALPQGGATNALYQRVPAGIYLVVDQQGRAMQTLSIVR
jgi:hypothetical protein